LKDYLDIFTEAQVYSFIATAALFSGKYATFSKALAKLETLDVFSEEEKQQMADLAVDTFSE
jgi:hypothetical protein